MKLFFLRSTLFFSCLMSLALLSKGQATTTITQGQITGKVIDSKNGEAVDFATVSLFLKSANQPAKVTQTDQSGAFSITNIANGAYTLKISFVGYQPHQIENLQIDNSKKNIALGTIKLSPSQSTVLQEVVVEGQRNTMQLGIDRKVFSVAQSLVSEGGSATDLLANVPSVSVDVDGNVSLRGTNNVRVLIDGKPSAIGGGNIAQILQSLPANAIENIELITNPSAKFDPEGQSGIINIVLKKNKKIGLNGSVSTSVGTRDNYNASGNLSYRDGKVNLYGNYNFRSGNRNGGGFNNTTFLNSFGSVFNNSKSNRNDLSNTIKLGADYYINSKTTLGVSGNMSFRDNKGFENLNYVMQNLEDQSGSSLRNTNRTGNSNGYDLSLDFNRQLKKKGETLSGNFSFGRNQDDETQNFNQNFYTTSGDLKDIIDRRFNTNGDFTQNYNMQVDYSLPITDKQKFEVGYRGTIRKNDKTQLSEVFNATDNDFKTDPSQTNDFLLDDQVYALYTSYQNQLTDKFGLQVGLRAEQAYLNTEYQGFDASAQSNKVKGSLDYFRVYPSVFLTQKLNKQQQLQVSYTRRVNRPRGWQVTPFADISDPNNIRIGNPNLRPEDINSFELSYMKYWKAITFTSSAYFRQVNDVVQGIRMPLPDNNAATITQFFNLTRSRSSGLELISKADIVKNFNLTANVNLFYSQFKGNEAYNIKSNDGFNWNANLTGNIKLPYNLSGQFNVNYMAPRTGAQGRSNEMYGMDAGLRMDVLKNKAGSISFNVRDILNSRKWGQTTETQFFIQQSERRMMGRMANLTFSYRFGKQDLKPKGKRNDQTESRPDEEQF
ncbi:MAG TPA: TonB-dependent receptor [Daejeonella sp.]|nr:TonB-dependent receptor [Daejeonella sp.]